jgi:hypothetical protein
MTRDRPSTTTASLTNKTKKTSWVKPDALKAEEDKSKFDTVDKKQQTSKQALKKQEKEKPRTAIIDYDEATLVLFNVFREKGIDHESKWDKVYDMLNQDERFQLVPNVKDRKKIFKTFVENAKNAFKKQLQDRKLQQKIDFKKMLEDYKHISIETKISSLLPIFYQDPRWTCMDEKEREEAFLEYMDDLFYKEAEAEKEVISKQCEKLKKQMLEIKRVSTSTKWDEIKEIMYYNNTWNDLHDYYKLK